ncbi:MAG: S24 family peptidase [Gammaproteobacteria bacterium]|nr:S24 family peptidase [Gammaproteobacteria bacterium]
MNDLVNCGASEPFALRVMGDDMAPEFEDGQVIVIDPGGLVKSGCYVVARLDDEQAIFRQLLVEDGQYRLRALKADLPEIVLERGVEAIVGVVSQRAGRRRREHKRYDT